MSLQILLFLYLKTPVRVMAQSSHARITGAGNISRIEGLYCKVRRNWPQSAELSEAKCSGIKIIAALLVDRKTGREFTANVELLPKRADWLDNTDRVIKNLKKILTGTEGASVFSGVWEGLPVQSVDLASSDVSYVTLPDGTLHGELSIPVTALVTYPWYSLKEGWTKKQKLVGTAVQAGNLSFEVL